MRVLFLDCSRRYGGASSRCLNLLSMAPRGTWALAGLKNSAVVKEAEKRGFEVHIIGRSKCDPTIFFRLKKLIREEKFQLIDVQNPQSKFWGVLAAPRTVPLISTLNSWYINEHGGSLKGRCYQFLELKSAFRTAAFIAVSREIEGKLKTEGIAAEKIHYVHNGIGAEVAAVEADRQWLGRTFGIDVSGTVCCAVGRLVQAKGFEHLIRGLARLKDRPVSCLIVGDGGERQKLERMIAERKLGERIKITGMQAQDDVYRIVKSSDIYILSSVTEGMPMSVLEAAILEKPILATRVGQLPETFSDRKEALLIEKADDVKIASGVIELMDDPEKAGEMGVRAGERIRQAFSLDSQIRALEEIYKRHLEAGPQR